MLPNSTYVIGPGFCPLLLSSHWPPAVSTSGPLLGLVPLPGVHSLSFSHHTSVSSRVASLEPLPHRAHHPVCFLVQVAPSVTLCLYSIILCPPLESEPHETRDQA